MRTPRRTVAAFALASTAIAIAAFPAGAASTWDLDYSASSATVGTFAIPNTATYGQTFAVPEGPTRIESFSFVLEVAPSAVFRAVLQAWDPVAARPTGAPLYMGGPLSTTDAARQTVTIAPDVAITPGTYVAYLTLSYDDQANTPGANANRWATSASPYADGTFVYMNNGPDESLLLTNAWLTFGVDTDLAFTVAYAAPPVVPPPTSPPAPPAPPAPPTSSPATPVTVPPAYTG